jgi:hypothetical protein
VQFSKLLFKFATQRDFPEDSFITQERRQMHDDKGIYRGCIITARMYTREASELFDVSNFKKANAVYFFGVEAHDHQDNPNGLVIHIARKIAYGCEMRAGSVFPETG